MMDTLKMLLKMSVVLAVLACIPLAAHAGGGGAPANTAGNAAAEDDVMHITLRASLASPLFSEFPVAVVNDEKITLQELKDVIAEAHGESMEEEARAADVSFSTLLDRMITIRLFAQEARNVGLDDVPEFKKSVENYSQGVLRRLYRAELVKGVKADPSETDAIYKDSVREWKTRSLLFSRKEDAEKFETSMKKGKSFDEVRDAALREGTAKDSGEATYNRTTASPDMIKHLAGMRVGSISFMQTITHGHDKSFSIVRLEEVRYPDSPEQRALADQEALKRAEKRAIQKEEKQLLQKYVQINKKLFASLDYEPAGPDAEEKVKRIMTDQRVVATIRGEKNVTVAELSTSVAGIFYHGLESLKINKANQKKEQVLMDLVSKRTMQIEARKRGIQKTPEYKATVDGFETTMLFNAYVRTVLIPEANVTEEKMEAYYRDHLSEFPAPLALSISSLSFKNKADAEHALATLKKGAAFSWVKENAGGQTPESPDITEWKGNFVEVRDLPVIIQKAVSGAKAGDFRIVENPGLNYYVLAILEVHDPGAMPYEEAKPLVKQKVAGIELDKIAKDYIQKLKQKSKITIYLVESKK